MSAERTSTLACARDYHPCRFLYFKKYSTTIDPLRTSLITLPSLWLFFTLQSPNKEYQIVNPFSPHVHAKRVKDGRRRATDARPCGLLVLTTVFAAFLRRTSGGKTENDGRVASVRPLVEIWHKPCATCTFRVTAQPPLCFH